MEITEYTNANGETCVTWTDDQGTHSMSKATYDAQQSQPTNPPQVND